MTDLELQTLRADEAEDAMAKLALEHATVLAQLEVAEQLAQAAGMLVLQRDAAEGRVAELEADLHRCRTQLEEFHPGTQHETLKAAQAALFEAQEIHQRDGEALAEARTALVKAQDRIAELESTYEAARFAGVICATCWGR